MSEAGDAAQVAEWMRSNSVPLLSMDPGADATDLGFLDQTLAGVTVVGLAETTHTTKEFFQLRHRMLRHLVNELGFRTVAIEASESAVEPLNDYLMSGEGDLMSLVTDLKAVIWNVEEFIDVLRWVRSYNASVSNSAKVRLFGLDMAPTERGRAELRAYLTTNAPDAVWATETLDYLASIETPAKHISKDTDAVDEAVLRNVERISAFLESNREPLIAQTSADEYARVVRHVTVIVQWVSAHVAKTTPPEIPRREGFNVYLRSRYMAENVVRVAEATAGAKMVIWAHTFHLAVGWWDREHGRVANMGHYLRERYGEQYYVFGFELNQGTYLARRWAPDETTLLGDLVVGHVPSSPEGSLPWHLMCVGNSPLALNVRGSSRPAAVVSWLGETRPMHSIAWAYLEPLVQYTDVVVGDAYDALVFVDETSPTTPTASAMRAVAARAAH